MYYYLNSIAFIGFWILLFTISGVDTKAFGDFGDSSPKPWLIFGFCLVHISLLMGYVWGHDETDSREFTKTLLIIWFITSAVSSTAFLMSSLQLTQDTCDLMKELIYDQWDSQEHSVTYMIENNCTGLALRGDLCNTTCCDETYTKLVDYAVNTRQYCTHVATGLSMLLFILGPFIDLILQLVTCNFFSL